MSIPSRVPESGGVESVLRKLVLAAAALLGVGYIVVNIPIVILLSYRFLQIPISSMENIVVISGITLFLMSSVLLMMLGVFSIIGGFQFYRRSDPQGVMFFGSVLASFYLLCLGVGSLLMASQIDINAMLLIISPVVTMCAVAIYMGRLSRFKLIGSILGIIGGILLAMTIFNQQTLSLVFDWNVPFSGPFMSFAATEAIVVILGPVTAFIYSMVAEQRENAIAHAFVSIVALVYGIGTFIGSQILAFSFLDILWKAPWLGPLHGVPPWFIGTVGLWSASLFLLMIGGIVTIISSCVGFIFTAQEFAQL